jgi:hypothetical protein
LTDEFTKLYVIIDDQDAHGRRRVSGIGLGWQHCTTLYPAPAGIGSLRDLGLAARHMEMGKVASRGTTMKLRKYCQAADQPASGYEASNKNAKDI